MIEDVAFTDRSPTIALCMIVRDESAVIVRCLESVRHLIDTWVIVDTGSSDGTPELIVRSLAEVPGALHHRTWRDFGHNRSELMRLARSAADYLLLLDADHTLQEATPLPLLDEGVDAYRLRHTGPVEYWISRLVRGDLAWRFEGRTHEYLTCDGPVVHAHLDAWEVVHHADGSSRASKFERDRMLLELTLAERPEDARTVFYLAQTLEALGERDAARERFEERARMGGFEEEAWYAQWRAASLLANVDPLVGLTQLLAAWDRRPRRLEPLRDAVELCGRQGWWTVAHALTSVGIDTEPPDDLLFVHRRLYEGVLIDDHVRACHELGRTAEAAAAEQRRRKFVDSLESSAGADTHHDLPGLEELVPAAHFSLVELEPRPEWATFNPSIASSGDELSMVLRSSNYERRSDGSYLIDGGSGRVVRTQNYFVRFDTRSAEGHSESALAPVSDVRPIVDRSGRRTFDTAVQNLEDGRLVRWDERWWMVASCRDSNARAMARVVLAELDVTADHEVTIVAAHVLPPPNDMVHEKNWSPYVCGDELRFVYSWAPLRLLRWDPARLTTILVTDADVGRTAASWRGGSAGIEVPGGWMFVIHEVAPGSSVRSYAHRFVLMDDQGEVSASSRFTFTGSEIEFAAGLASRGDDLVVSFGVEDRLAALVVVPVDAVTSHLK